MRGIGSSFLGENRQRRVGCRVREMLRLGLVHQKYPENVERLLPRHRDRSGSVIRVSSSRDWHHIQNARVHRHQQQIVQKFQQQELFIRSKKIYSQNVRMTNSGGDRYV